MDIQSLLGQFEIPTERRYESISLIEAEFLHQSVASHDGSATIEIGLGFGVSAASIMTAHASQHICIDPYQDSYGNLGLQNLSRIGLRDRLALVSNHSHAALPELLSQGRRFDFAFIDGGHLFDQIMVDFYFLDLLIDTQGLLVFHDTWMRSTQLVTSFIRSNRDDYRQLHSPDSLAVFEKCGTDGRSWDYFCEF